MPVVTSAQPNKQRMNSPRNMSTPLTRKSQDLIRQQMLHDYNACPVDVLRTRYKLLDLAYYMENDEHIQQTNASRIVTTLYKELELPILQPNIDAAHAYLIGIFTSGHPMFGVVHETAEDPAAQQENDQTAQSMEAIIAENSNNTGWKRHFNIWFKAALKYNIAAIEMDWKVQKSYNLETDTQVSLTQASVTEAYRAGNEAKHWDMYNTFFDTDTAPSQIHKEGDYTGNVERISVVKLKALIENLQANAGVVMNVNDALWKSSPMHNWYHVPTILSDNVLTSKMDWSVFFSTGTAPINNSSTSKYEKVTYFRRMIPNAFGISNVPDADKVQIWKFIEVNGILIYAERRSNAHNLFPVVFTQPHEDALGLQTKGLGQILMPFQKLSSTLYKGRVASLARALSDRAIYDPSRISDKHINSVIPTAKIPVRPGAYGKPVGDAIQVLPFDDRNGAMLHQDIAFVEAKSEQAAHLNKSQKGQFQKGNRTLHEYADVQDNADSTQLAMAQLIEEQAMTPIKILIKTNILQYQSGTTLPIPNSNKTINIDPVELRKSISTFKLADGLMNKDKLLGLQPTLEAFQMLVQSPEANQQYDLTRMLVSTLSARGAKISMFKRSPEELQQMAQQQAAANGQTIEGEPQDQQQQAPPQ